MAGGRDGLTAMASRMLRACLCRVADTGGRSPPRYTICPIPLLQCLLPSCPRRVRREQEHPAGCLVRPEAEEQALMRRSYHSRLTGMVCEAMAACREAAATGIPLDEMTAMRAERAS